LATVEYFHYQKTPSDPAFHGRLSGIPRIILSLELKNILTLAKEVSVEKQTARVETRGSTLVNHPAQILLTKEVIDQLDLYLKYAKSSTSPFAVRTIPQLEGQHAKFKQILDAKLRSGNFIGFADKINDTSNQQLVETIKSTFKLE
jgi:hypothetical protein